MKCRILVAEDCPTQAEHLRYLLASAGYQVTLVATGVEGLQQVRRQPPDLIISDIVMPDMDGFDFCRAVKADAATRQIPFVMLTVLREPADVIIGLECGADNFITKPVDNDYLLLRVERILDNRNREGQGTPPVASLVHVGNRRIPVAAAKEQLVELLLAIVHQLGQVKQQLVESRRLGEQYETELGWVKRIMEALEKNRLRLYYQPILDLRNHRVTRHELLLRMLMPDGAVVPPGAFLHVAEKSGIIQQVDRWVLRQAFALLERASKTGQGLRLTVNLSGRSLVGSDLLRTVEHELRTRKVDPADLTFEVTESGVITNRDEAVHVITALRNLGFRFALDDFGVGFSTFDCLKQLPLDGVKIDGSFIRNLARSPVDQRLVKAIVEVAKALGKQTVAEFVGSQDTMDLLVQYGADFAQGYYVGRPAPHLSGSDMSGCQGGTGQRKR